MSKLNRFLSLLLCAALLLTVVPALAGAEEPEKSTTTLGAVTFESMPFSCGGLTVTDILQGGYETLVFLVRNDTGHAVSSWSYIRYKFYDAEGLVIKSDDLYTLPMNAGEQCKVSMIIPDGAVRMVLLGAKAEEGEETVDLTNTETTEKYCSMSLNTPFSQEGMDVTLYNVQDARKVVLLATNNTDTTLGTSTYVTYKCYDWDGYVIEYSGTSLLHTDPGETAKVSFTVPRGTATVLLNSIVPFEGTSAVTDKTAIVNRRDCNALPYDLGADIAITDLHFCGGELIFDLKNSSNGVRAGGVNYKCYNKEGYVIYCGSMASDGIPAGEVGQASGYYTNGAVTKIRFYDPSGYESTLAVEEEPEEDPDVELPDEETWTIWDSVKGPKTPLDLADGQITITRFFVKGANIYAVVRNNTDQTIADTSDIDVRTVTIYKKLQNSRSAQIWEMDPGESCLVKMSYWWRCSRLLVDNATIDFVDPDRFLEE